MGLDADRSAADAGRSGRRGAGGVEDSDGDEGAIAADDPADRSHCAGTVLVAAGAAIARRARRGDDGVGLGRARRDVGDGEFFGRWRRRRSWGIERRRRWIVFLVVEFGRVVEFVVGDGGIDHGQQRFLGVGRIVLGFERFRFECGVPRIVEPIWGVVEFVVEQDDFEQFLIVFGIIFEVLERIGGGRGGVDGAGRIWGPGLGLDERRRKRLHAGVADGLAGGQAGNQGAGGGRI